MTLGLTVQIPGFIPSIPHAGPGNHRTQPEILKFLDRFLEFPQNLAIHFLRRIGRLCAIFLSPGVFVRCLSASRINHIVYVHGGNITGECDHSDSAQKLPHWWNAPRFAQSESNGECGVMAAVSPGEFMACRRIKSRNRNTCWEQSLDGLSGIQIIRLNSVLLPGFGW